MFATLNDKSMHCQSKRKAFIALSNIPSDDETSDNSFKCTAIQDNPRDWWKTPWLLSIQDMLPTKTDKENHISRSNAGSFSIWLNSVKVVAPVHWSSPLARAGFEILLASTEPSAEPAPTIVWTSSQWKMTCLSQSLKYRTLEFFYSIIFRTETEGVFGPKVMCQSIHSLNQTWHCKHAARGECAVAMGCSISQTLMSYVLKNSEQNGQVWTKWKET